MFFNLFYQLVFRLFVSSLTISIYVSDTVYCDSYECPYGYALIDDADHEECEYGKCEKSKCCDKVCSSYDCPKHYKLKSGYDKIKCDYSGCTTDKCCKHDCESPLSADYTSVSYTHLTLPTICSV